MWKRCFLSWLNQSAAPRPGVWNRLIHSTEQKGEKKEQVKGPGSVWWQLYCIGRCRGDKSFLLLGSRWGKGNEPSPVTSRLLHVPNTAAGRGPGPHSHRPPPCTYRWQLRSCQPKCMPRPPAHRCQETACAWNKYSSKPVKRVIL